MVSRLLHVHTTAKEPTRQRQRPKPPSPREVASPQAMTVGARPHAVKALTPMRKIIKDLLALSRQVCYNGIVDKNTYSPSWLEALAPGLFCFTGKTGDAGSSAPLPPVPIRSTAGDQWSPLRKHGPPHGQKALPPGELSPQVTERTRSSSYA